MSISRVDAIPIDIEIDDASKTPLPVPLDQDRALLTLDQSFWEAYRRLSRFVGVDIFEFRKEFHALENVSDEPLDVTQGSREEVSPMDTALYLERRRALLQAKMLTCPAAASRVSELALNTGNVDTNLDLDTYASKRRLLLESKFELLSSMANDVLMKQQAAAALRRAVQAERSLIRSQELTLTMLNEEEDEAKHVLKLGFILRLEGKVTKLALMSRGKKLCAIGHGGGIVTLCNLDSGKVIATLEAHNAAITSMSFSSRNNILVTTSMDKTARMWVVDLGLLKDGAKVVAAENITPLTLCRLIPFKGVPMIGAFPPATSHVGSGSKDEAVCVVVENDGGEGKIHAIDALGGKITQTLVNLDKLGKLMQKLGANDLSTITSLGVKAATMGKGKGKKVKTAVASLTFKDDGKHLYISLTSGVVLGIIFNGGEALESGRAFGRVTRMGTSSYLEEAKKVAKVGSGIVKRRSFGGGGGGDDEDARQKIPPFCQSMKYRTYDTIKKSPVIVGIDASNQLHMVTLKRKKSVSGNALAAGMSMSLDLESSFLPNSELKIYACVDISTLTNMIVAGGVDGAVSIFDPNLPPLDCKISSVPHLHGGAVNDIKWSWDDEVVVSGDVNGDVCVWAVTMESKKCIEGRAGGEGNKEKTFDKRRERRKSGVSAKRGARTEEVLRGWN